MSFKFQQQNILNPYAWTVGSGSFTGFNTISGESYRVSDTDPFGNTSVVWETRPTGDSGADGGWNTTTFSVDPTKMYRFSVWVRRTSSTGGGTFYLGYGGTVVRFSDGGDEGNPYWNCSSPGGLTQNLWYLAVGHVFPHNYTGSTASGHPNSGFWTIASGKIGNLNGCNIGVECKFKSDASTAYHRCYHYYCTDSTTRLQFFEPKVEICNGSEMSIAELLTASGSTLASTSISPEGASVKHQNVVASGGDEITTNGEWRIHRFNSTGTFTLTSFIGESLFVDYLIVGGGGGGGMDMGGGGGGGGVLFRVNMPLIAGSYTATVGGGGAGAPAAGASGQPGSHQFTIRAVAGTNSSFNGETAYGGGYGASSVYTYTPDHGTPGNGGCGGGPSGYCNDATSRSGGTGTSGQGYAGGNTVGSAYYSGGGGGAGAVGTNANSQPTGGAGKYCNILGRPFYWGGGGGGSSYSLSTGGEGGIGGGGGGALGTTLGGRQSIAWGSPGGYGAPNSQANVPGGNGAPNTGGGGGGGSHYSATNQGGNGGSGIVIIRYKYK